MSEEPTIELKPFKMNEADLTFLEFRRFQLAEICRWFGCAPIERIPPKDEDAA